VDRTRRRHGFEIKGISEKMMRLFSSRRASITRGLRARRRRGFEQQYGARSSSASSPELRQASNSARARARKARLKPRS